MLFAAFIGLPSAANLVQYGAKARRILSPRLLIGNSRRLPSLECPKVCNPLILLMLFSEEPARNSYKEGCRHLSSRSHHFTILLSDVAFVTRQGHSESKGAKKREKGGNAKPSRGVATSFGFRRRPASSSRADDNARRPRDGNGNTGGGSTEDLRPEEVLSGRSTPLARPRKEAVGQPLRSNRFGFRQGGITKTAKVGDVSVGAEQAFGAPADEKETAINNNALDKKSTNPVYNNQLPLIATQVSSTGVTTVVGAAGVPKAVTKQTVILTYQPQQYSVQERPRKFHDASSRNNSANRVHFAEPATPRGGFERTQTGGKFTLQTTQLPRPQYPALKVIDKNAKQVSVEDWLA
ncbi:hypothetical protein EVAR_84934_1 [Eumeta japonica]|uniref:Uncharacterized protein n=1 Tax=Eumeta variegata TaxID=151549 RepID=A0A4C1VI18_EUMVA|nr:hypothetical protein EVAR_84934_1 [Eumeta japonica]